MCDLSIWATASEGSLKHKPLVVWQYVIEEVQIFLYLLTFSFFWYSAIGNSPSSEQKLLLFSIEAPALKISWGPPYRKIMA